MRLVEHLHQGAPGVNALDDRDAIDHAAGTTIPLRQNQNVAGAKSVDGFLELGPVLDALAGRLLREDPITSATSAPNWRSRF